jgi:transposase
MFDVSDEAKGEFRRVEVLTGPGRRRRWSADEKARIVAETLTPGARVSEVARRWQVCSQQVFGWRRAMRQDLPNVAGPTTTPAASSFVPIVSEAIPVATVQRGVCRLIFAKEHILSPPWRRRCWPRIRSPVW